MLIRYKSEHIPSFELFSFICPACHWQEYYTRDIMESHDYDFLHLKTRTTSMYCEGCGQAIECTMENVVYVEKFIEIKGRRTYPDKTFTLECPKCGFKEGLPARDIGIEISYEWLDGKFHEVTCSKCEHIYKARFDDVLDLQLEAYLQRMAVKKETQE